NLHRWVRVRGVVIYGPPGRALFIQDDVDGLMIHTAQDTPLTPGDVIEATGLPGLQDNRVVLREAVYRKIDHVAEPAPIFLSEPHVVVATLDGRLARVRGRLINGAADPNAVALA